MSKWFIFQNILSFELYFVDSDYRLRNFFHIPIFQIWYSKFKISYQRVKCISMTYQTKCCEMKGKKLNFWQFSKTLKTAAMFRLTFLFVWQPLSFHVIYPALPVIIFLQTGSLKQQSSNHKSFMISYDSLSTSSIKMLINHCMKS